MEGVKKYQQLSDNQDLKDCLFEICKKLDMMNNFLDVYHDYGTMSQAEAQEQEWDYVINLNSAEFVAQYPKNFPNGTYKDKDYSEAWIDAYIHYAENILKKKGTPLLSQDVKSKSNTVYFRADKKAKEYRAIASQIDKSKPSPLSTKALDYLDLMDGLYLATSADTTQALTFISRSGGSFATPYTEILRNSVFIAQELGKENTEIGRICKEKEAIIERWRKYITKQY